MEQEVKKTGVEKLKEIAVSEPINIALPMDLVYKKAFVSGDIYINGIEEVDLTDTQKRAVIHRIMRFYKNNPYELRDLLRFFIKSQSQWCESRGLRKVFEVKI